MMLAKPRIYIQRISSAGASLHLDTLYISLPFGIFSVAVELQEGADNLREITG